MSEIKDFLKATLPKLSEANIVAVEKKIHELGMDCLEDMEFLKPEEDLVDVDCMTVFCCRKLDAKLKKKFGPEPVSAEAASPHAQNMPKPHEPVVLESLPGNVTVSKRKEAQTWAVRYTIPWDKFTDEIHNACRKKERPMKRDLLEMVRTLHKDIARIDNNPGKANLDEIAKKIVQKYPNSFKDAVPNAELLNKGHSSLAGRLRDRFDNVNRQSAGTSLKRKLLAVEQDSEQENTSKSRIPASTLLKDSYGCVRWQPDLPEGESEDSQEEKRMWLVEEFPKQDRDDKGVSEKMSSTFATVRYAINRHTSLPVLRSQWPFLFTPCYLKTHFEYLMDFNLHNVMSEKLAKKGDHILEFFEASKNSGASLAAKQLFLYAEGSESITEAKHHGLVLILPVYFGEDKDLLFKFVQETATDAELEENDKTKHPHVAIAGHNPFTAKCFVLAEGCILASEVGFGGALEIMFAAYYCFNMAYPDGVGATLEFIQRILACINPGRGSKMERADKRKKFSTIHSKVLRICNALKDFNNDWDCT